MFNEKWTFLNRLVFHLPKKEPEPTQNIGSGSRSNFKSAPAPAPAKKNLGPGRLRFRNTDYTNVFLGNLILLNLNNLIDSPNVNY